MEKNGLIKAYLAIATLMIVMAWVLCIRNADCKTACNISIYPCMIITLVVSSGLILIIAAAKSESSDKKKSPKGDESKNDEKDGSKADAKKETEADRRNKIAEKRLLMFHEERMALIKAFGNRQETTARPETTAIDKWVEALNHLKPIDLPEAGSTGSDETKENPTAQSRQPDAALPF